jgi:hypothetical protein
MERGMGKGNWKNNWWGTSRELEGGLVRYFKGNWKYFGKATLKGRPRNWGTPRGGILSATFKEPFKLRLVREYPPIHAVCV